MIRQLVEEIVKSLVDKPSQVEVHENQGSEGSIKLSIKIAETDLGKVIGRNGQTIKAIRAVVNAVKQQDKEITVDIVQ